MSAGRADGLRRLVARSSLAAVAAAVLAGLLDAPDLEAQDRRFRVAEPRWEVDTWLGLYSPRGDLAEATADGVVAGLGVGYAVGPRAALRVEGTFVSLDRTGGREDLLGGVRGPNADFWHLTAGFEFELTGPDASSWHVTFALMGGATRQDVGEPAGEGASPAVGPVEAWVGTFNAHYGVGYDVSRRVRLLARAGGYLMMGDAGDLESSFLGKEAALSMSAGLRLRL